MTYCQMPPSHQMPNQTTIMTNEAWPQIMAIDDRQQVGHGHGRFRGRFTREKTRNAHLICPAKAQ